MKIGFLITYFYPQMGGAESNCYYLARELAKKHEVHVFCSGEHDSEEVIENIHVHRSKELFRVKYYLAYYPSIIESLLRYKLDILHVHGFGFMQHDAAVKKMKQKNPKMKIVCTPHGPFMALKKYNLLGTIFKSAYTPLIRKSLKDYDSIVQVNPYQKSWMTSEYRIPSKKIHFIPNGIPRSAFSRVESRTKKSVEKKYSLKGRFVISYVGRIQKYKGLDQVIKVLPSVVKKYPFVTFLAIGKDSGDRGRLEKLSDDLGVKDNVIFAGEVSEKEKYALLDLSEVFIFPSEWEAFGIVVLEAMARGNAIISSSTEGGRYLVERPNGLIFPYGNVAKLKSDLLHVLDNPRSMKRMQQNNISKAKSFLWEKIVPNLENLYLDLVNRVR